MRALFRPLGRTLLLETDSDAILAIARDTFGRFGLAEGPPDVTLRLLLDADGEVGGPVFRQDGSRLLQTAGPGAVLTADPGQGIATGSFSPRALDSPAFFRSHFLLFGFLSLLQPRGLMGVHGSALVQDGKGILLRGPSGSGKTTLAYAGARSRFQALAEDVVWVDLQNGLWRGIPWYFHLLPDASRLFPELADLPAELEIAGRMKIEVDLETIRPGRSATEARPGAVVLLDRSPGSGSRLDRLDRATALDGWSRCPAGTEESFPGYRQRIESLLQNGVWRLRLGTDLEEALDLVESLLK